AHPAALRPTGRSVTQRDRRRDVVFFAAAVVTGAFLVAAFLAGAFLAVVDLLAVDFFADVDFFAGVDFFADVDFVAADFFAAVDFFADVDFFAVDLFAVDFFVAACFFAADRCAVGPRVAPPRLRISAPASTSAFCTDPYERPESSAIARMLSPRLYRRKKSLVILSRADPVTRAPFATVVATLPP